MLSGEESGFMTYFLEGIRHISDPGGADHIVFLLVLCAVFEIHQWKNVLILATAFTLGHSISLVLSVFKWVYLPGEWAEFLIPLTILITALYNVIRRNSNAPGKNQSFKYLLALVFGVVHGFGFAGYFRMILDEGVSIWKPLLAFNLGVEIGQVAIVLIFLVLGFLLMGFLKIKLSSWNIFLSGMGFGIALIMLQENWIF